MLTQRQLLNTYCKSTSIEESSGRVGEAGPAAGVGLELGVGVTAGVGVTVGVGVAGVDPATDTPTRTPLHVELTVVHPVVTGCRFEHDVPQYARNRGIPFDRPPK